MRTAAIIILFLLTGCLEQITGKADHLSSGSDMTVSTGYETAVIDNTLYVVKDHNPKDNTDFLSSMGQACKMWAGVITKNQTLVANGNPVVNHHYRFKLVLKDEAQTNKDCAALSGVQNTTACTEHLDNGCRSHLAPTQSDAIWGWECGACFSPELT